LASSGASGADQHHIARDQAAIHFVQDDFTTELGRYVSFATPHDRRMRFEQTHQLGGGRHTFAVQHTPLGLRDDLLDQRHHVLEGRLQPLHDRFRAFGQRASDLFSLTHARLRHSQ
jgi:hypothetical protein